MFQMISVLFSLILLFAYFKFKEKAKRKYAGSIVFQIIDREYSNWYKRERNGIVINKKTTSMFEVDKVVFGLKEKFEVQGISKEQLKDYLDFLYNNEPKKIGIYSIILAVFGYLGSTKFLKVLLPDLSNIKDVPTVFNNVADTFNKYRDFALIVLYLLLFIAIIVLLSYISYKIATIDNMYIDTQKIYVLKRAEKIWDFEKDYSVYTNTDARDKFKDRNNLIFPELEDSKSKFEKDFNRAIGDTFNRNDDFFKNLPGINMIKWKSVKEWFLGMLIPVIFIIIIFIMSYLMVFYKDEFPTILIFAMYIITLYIVYLFMLIYMTQIDRQNKLIVTEQPNMVTPEQAESESQNEVRRLEYSDSGEVKLKIKRRHYINKRIYFSLATTVLIHYILYSIFVNGSLSLWG
ncbi:hypothetical protein D065_07395 [Streptococcus mitis 13/39]|uniref:Uncharacterized protein n=1 Tax=Streptococcus mitis 13/39 TaxID=1239793 RepID=R0NPK7_STRMT|nr:hypothetical protein D065_07395 [Streptococcus mitis 13/39]